LTNFKKYTILFLAHYKSGRRIMKEIRVEDNKEGGINLNLRCCGEKFCTNNEIIDGQFCFIPKQQQDMSQKICCIRCRQLCEISYDDGFYVIQLPGLLIVYNQGKKGKEICVSGYCDCQNNTLSDDFTKKRCKDHCVDSRVPGIYTFSCPCNRTHIVIVREDHFHVCSKGECPVLSAQQSKK
jgi:hypothetical protein